ncbi:hypothetical protein [Mycolicibacterium conceptionense]|uniref:hypothetical protein n=1 Tax=Mycolicibacterium conceptionense TaxID=451644 RepID=UPI0002F2082D|nr:hypothetical protein [Mycolicibacterium conceptionense]OBK09038.1 hypothetical protein A5639_11950 [Mycolicibacterium conceptionense]
MSRFEADNLLFPDLLTRSERREMRREAKPRFLYQSMGAGVQSTTIALLAADGVIPKPDFAVFSDTGWEPQEVYDHLNELDEKVLRPAGITLVRVQAGNIFDEAVDHHFPRSLPLYTRDAQTGEPGGITSRACTSNFKLAPIFRWLREQLGGTVSDRQCTFCDGAGERYAPWLVQTLGQCPDAWGICSVCRGTGVRRMVGTPPEGVWAQSYVGFSSDEIERVSPSRMGYAFDTFPLIGRDQAGDPLIPDLNMSREDCERFNIAHGWTEVVKSACIGCPWHKNAAWREIKANPERWQQAVALDRAVRRTPMLDSDCFIHPDRIPLDQVDLSTGDDDVERPGCSPYGCRTGLEGGEAELPLFDEEDGAA